ncbi:hypothetical protein EC991_004544 [Linnemannia zychae]|nr:hypothetical protein EC991_004544 [Linnemannia zychae]
MVSIILLLLAPALIGVAIFGTTLIFSKPDKKPIVNTGLGNITTTARLVTTALIPEKVTTTVSLVFTTAPPVVTTFSIIPSVAPPITANTATTEEAIVVNITPIVVSTSTSTTATTITEAPVATNAVTTTKSTSTASTSSAALTKSSGWTIFPGVAIPNPFDIFNPPNPPKSTATIVPTTVPITKEAVRITTSTGSTTVAVSPSPTKKSGWTFFSGVTIPNPVGLYLHDHDHEFTKGKTESRARQDPAKADTIDSNDDEQEDEHVEDESKDDSDTDQEDSVEDEDEIEHAKQHVRQDDDVREEEANIDEESANKTEKHKKQTKKGGQQDVSPPAKTLYHLTEAPTSTSIATPSIAPVRPAINVAPKENFFTDELYKEEGLPIPLVSPPAPIADSSISETEDPAFKELESVIEQLVDEQATSFEESLELIVNNIMQSDEIEPYQDLLFESIAVSKLEIPDTFDDSTLDFHTEDEAEVLYSFRASPNSRDPAFQGPRAVSRASILTSIINTLLPPFVLRFRADLRNFLFWICSPNASAHIDGKDSNGDDSLAQKFAQEDVDKLIHPDGSIDLKALWDPRIGTLALECLKSHASIFVNEVVSLAGTRFTQIKEFLIAQLRGLIGLPKWLLPFSFDDPTLVAQSTISSPGLQEQSTEQEIKGLETQGIDKLADLEVPIQDQQRKHGRPSPASDRAQNLRVIQRIDPVVANTHKADEFLTWFVDSVVSELQDGYFANAKAAAVSRVELTESQATTSSGNANEADERTCGWMKEQIEKVFQ